MEHKKCMSCNNSYVIPIEGLPPTFTSLLPWNFSVSEALLCIVQDPGLMYYCNTCSQPLCSSCRELTHKARMFSHHEIVSMAKRTKAKHRKCCKKKRNLNFHET